MARPPLNERDVLIEFHAVGNIVRVSAIDPVTNTEVIIQGPASAGKPVLARNALAKLNYVLRKGSS
ncbi:DUF6898 family protein [Niveispirillum sp. KHB5.9]|uniref:DUF6898 family protein n=1 Tax=Niveispirillum sp. KHB5.9 TaxID=3400269 RepID=UPI003A840A2B